MWFVRITIFLFIEKTLLKINNRKLTRISPNVWKLNNLWASLVAQLVKNLPAVWETWVWSLVWEDPLEQGKATHSSILAWRIPWTVVHWVAKSRQDWATFTSLFWVEVSGEAVDARGKLTLPCLQEAQEINFPWEMCTPCIWRSKDTLTVGDREFEQRSLCKQTVILYKFTTISPKFI